jgi:ABC-type sugar transport system permease subunit
MGDDVFWMSFLIVVVMIIFGVIIAYLFSRNKKGQKTPDYYAFFIMGLIWFIAGLIFRNSPLGITGAIFILLALFNIKEWKQNEVKWHQLSKFEKRLRIWVLISLIIILIVAFVALFLV